MPIKYIKATTPGRRLYNSIDYSGLSKKRPENRLSVALKSKAGRNNQGKITVWHKGSGHKKRYRIIDFKNIDKKNIPGIVNAIEYDPNRNCFIALIFYKDGDKRYILAPDKLKNGDAVITAEKTKIKPANRLKLKFIPPGIEIHNIEINPGRGGQLIRSAGSAGRIVSLETEKAQIELPSGENRFISKECMASIGKLSNEDYINLKLGKAGRSRWLGIRPTVRGKAQNPIDHPHGGGEGNQPIGLKHPKTPWGAPALGKKTRKRKYSDKDILRRRAKR